MFLITKKYLIYSNLSLVVNSCDSEQLMSHKIFFPYILQYICASQEKIVLIRKNHSISNDV
jgi:hypothetical protein